MLSQNHQGSNALSRVQVLSRHMTQSQGGLLTYTTHKAEENHPSAEVCL